MKIFALLVAMASGMAGASGNTDRQAAVAANDRAVEALHQNQLGRAESLARQALDLARQAVAPGDPLLAAILNNLGQSYRFEGHYLEAERNYREAIGIWEAALGKQHPDTARGLMNLAALDHERGRDGGAEDLYRRADAIFEASYGKDHPLALVARNELGEVLRAEGRVSESERLSRETLEPLEKSLGDRDPRVIRALANYARLLDQTRHAPEAAAVRSRIRGLAAGFR